MDEIMIKRISSQFENVNRLYEEQKFDIALRELNLIIDELEKIYDVPEHHYYSFGHVLEVYLYTYIKCADKKLDELEVEFAELDISMYYRMKGLILIQTKKNEEAIMAYDRALKWNPVDLDSLFQIIELYKATGRIDSVRRVNNEAFNYCCTRATLAHYYRNIGFYYLEKYKPEIAIAAYQYSNIFYYTEAASDELEYLAKATDKKIEPLTTAQIQDIFKNDGIPFAPNPDTIAIIYQVGEMEFKSGSYDTAKDCYTMIYDVTNDSNVEEKLRQVNALLQNKE